MKVTFSPCAFGPLFKKMLRPGGSVVIEMGNSWEPGEPVMSTLALRSLLEFQSKNGLHLCQEFIWQNPAKLPSPVPWVNIERIRVKDSFTKLWWMSPTVKPKANNQHVLQEYSAAMKGLVFSKSTGICWIQTDDGACTDVTNCMMLAAMPGRAGGRRREEDAEPHARGGPDAGPRRG